MVGDLLDDLFNAAAKDMADSKVQAELQQFVKEHDGNYRRAVEQQELGMDGINRNESGDYEQRGRKPDESVLNAALDRVDKRMLTESPDLVKQKLTVSAGNVTLDKKAYRREVE